MGRWHGAHSLAAPLADDRGDQGLSGARPHGQGAIPGWPASQALSIRGGARWLDGPAGSARQARDRLDARQLALSPAGRSRRTGQAMTSVVLGGTGLIGRHVIAAL